MKDNKVIKSEKEERKEMKNSHKNDRPITNYLLDKLEEQAKESVMVNCYHAVCPNCGENVDVIPSDGTFVTATPPVSKEGGEIANPSQMAYDIYEKNLRASIDSIDANEPIITIVESMIEFADQQLSSQKAEVERYRKALEDIYNHIGALQIVSCQPIAEVIYEALNPKSK